MSKLFPHELPLESDDRRSMPALYLIATVHAAAGGFALVGAVTKRLDGVWLLAALGGLVLVLHAGLVAFHRRPSGYQLGRALVMVFRVGGAGTLMVGAMAMREHMAGAYPVMGIGLAIALAIALWGVGLGALLESCQRTFQPPAAP